MKLLSYAAIAIGLSALPVSAASVLVGSSDGTIAQLDTDTGTLSNAFDAGNYSWFDIAIDNSGTGYGINGGSELYSININTQSVAKIGNTGRTVNGLAFGDGGALYGTGGGNLYSLNTGNGAASVVGSGVGGNFNSSGDIAFAGGTTFYGTSTSNCGNVGSGLGGDCLWSIDAVTGLGSAVGGTGVGSVYGLALTGGTLFGLSSANNAYSLDTSDGTATFLTAYNLSGSTFGAGVPPSAVVPVPASLPLLLGGLLGFGAVARARRKRQG